METVIAGHPGFPGAVEVQRTAGAADPSCAFGNKGVMGNTPSRVAAAAAAVEESLVATSSTMFPGTSFSQPSPLLDVTTVAPPQAGDRNRNSSGGGGGGGGGAGAYLGLGDHGSCAASVLGSLPEDVPPHDDHRMMRGSSMTTLASRKRSQPTGGWGWPGGDANGVEDTDHHHPTTPQREYHHHRHHHHDHGRRRQMEQRSRGGYNMEGMGRGTSAGEDSSPTRFMRQGAYVGAAGPASAGNSSAVCADYEKTAAAVSTAAATSAAGASSGGSRRGSVAAGPRSRSEITQHDVGEYPGDYTLRATTMTPTSLASGVSGAGGGSAAFAGASAAADRDKPGAAAAAASSSSTGVVKSGADKVSCLGDFNFSFAEMNKMSKRYSTVNTLGAQTPMPLLGWLTRELDISHHDLRGLILRHPRLMAYRVTSHVAPKTKWLRERLGLGKAALRKFVTTYPAVLSRSVEKNLEPKFKWLEERLGASQEEVAMLIKRFPLIFGYSTTQNLEPTVLFFAADMSGEQEEIRSAVMSCPSILSRSLDKRMVPRARLMREKEIEPRFGPHKWVVSTYTDAQFTRWLEGRSA